MICKKCLMRKLYGKKQQASPIFNPVIPIPHFLCAPLNNSEFLEIAEIFLPKLYYIFANNLKMNIVSKTHN